MQQKGYATILALLVTMFLLGMMAVLFPKLNNAIFASKTERSLLAAQYAAEAGAKRAIAAFYQPTPDWTWLDAWQGIGTGAYRVQIEPLPASSVESGSYVITAKGRDGGVTKTASVTVTISGGGPNYAMYAANNIVINGNLLLQGKIGATGTISQSGTVTYVDHDSKLLPNQQEDWWFDDYAAFKKSKTTPGFLTSTNRPVNPDIKVSSDLDKGQTYSNQTIVINGDLLLSGTKNFTNTSIFVSGNIVSSGNTSFTNHCLVVAGNSITVSGSNLGGAVYISYGSITYSGTIKGGAVYAKNDIIASGNSSLIYSRSAMEANQLTSGFPGAGASRTMEIGSWRE